MLVLQLLQLLLKLESILAMAMEKVIKLTLLEMKILRLMLER